eukprot:Seg7610.1 transcript_id=Seg7610.1/GoldUCD/mRNA.D3Y31 product="hypothetical protein" protein_id=Seg7610.1/GoldUCD/D3Y31
MQFTFWVVVVIFVLLHSRDAIGNDEVNPCQNKQEGKIIDVQNGVKECTINVCIDGKRRVGMVENQTRRCQMLLSEWERIGGSAGNDLPQKSCSGRNKTYENMSMLNVSETGSKICINGNIVRKVSVVLMVPFYGIEAWLDK